MRKTWIRNKKVEIEPMYSLFNDEQLMTDFCEKHMKDEWFDFFVTEELIKKANNLKELLPFRIKFCEKYETKFYDFADNYNQMKLDQYIDSQIDQRKEDL